MGIYLHVHLVTPGRVVHVNF